MGDLIQGFSDLFFGINLWNLGADLFIFALIGTIAIGAVESTKGRLLISTLGMASVTLLGWTTFIGGTVGLVILTIITTTMHFKDGGTTTE